MRRATGLLVLVGLCGMVLPGAADQPLAVGSRVAALYYDGGWYTGAVASIDGDSYTVHYDDDSSSSVDAGNLVALSKDLKLAVGDQVLAVWSSCYMYPGTVQEVGKADALIAWEDGSDPSTVALDLIIHRPSGYGEGTGSEPLSIWKDGDLIGAIEDDGTVWLGGDMAGKLEPNGDVRVDGSIVGSIDDDGTVWKDGSIIGSVEDDGTVLRDGDVVGYVDDEGTVFRDGNIYGAVPGASARQAAAVFFYFFLQD